MHNVQLYIVCRKATADKMHVIQNAQSVAAYVNWFPTNSIILLVTLCIYYARVQCMLSGHEIYTFWECILIGMAAMAACGRQNPLQFHSGV